MRSRRVIAGVAALAVTIGVSPALAESTTSTQGTTFVPGSATATAQAFQIAPRDAGLAATITFGRTVGQYRNSLAQASSQALDLGLIGNTLTVQCSSAPPPVRPGQLPKALSAESDTGPAHNERSFPGENGQLFTAATGREAVSATPAPNEDALADFEEQRLSVANLVSVDGLSSQSHAHLYAGQAREADSTADLATVRLAGKVELAGLHWSSTVRTGTRASSSSTFSVSSVSIGGARLPTASTAALSSTFAAVNKALAQTGLHVSLPQQTTDNGVVGMTPLSIGIDNSALGRLLVDPILNLFHMIADPALATVTTAICQLGSIYAAVNLLLVGFSGVGAFDLELGGTTATTNDTTYANPFGSGGATGASLPPPSANPAQPRGAATGNGKVPPLPAASGAPPLPPAPQVAGSRTVASSCATTSPAGRPTCSSGAGLAVSLIALATLGGVAGVDYLVVRRRRRLARMAIQP